MDTEEADIRRIDAKGWKFIATESTEVPEKDNGPWTQKIRMHGR